ncbi:MAG TPA: hypothetical protein VFO01_02490 [Trebonia sp.]|nr:hypothetical protein [Trebonia sp.]
MSVLTAAAVAAGVTGAAGLAVGVVPWGHGGHTSAAGQQGDFLKAANSTTFSNATADAQLDVIGSATTAGGAGASPATASKLAKQEPAKQQPAQAQVARARAAKPRPAKLRRPAPKTSYLIYDSVSPGAIPGGRAAAVYVNGAYAASPAQVAGHKSVLWIDTNGSDPAANVLDVEPGDATPAGAAQWVKQRLSSRPHAVAIVYTMRNDWQQVKDNVAALPAWMQSRVRYWIADPTGVPHVIAGANATQWYWGNSYDITTATPGFMH